MNRRTPHPPSQRFRVTTMADATREYIDHLEHPDPDVSPLADWFLKVPPPAQSKSKYEIGECFQLLRDGPYPGVTVAMIRELEDGRRDPTDPREAELLELMTDHFNLPKELPALQAAWFNGRGKR